MTSLSQKTKKFIFWVSLHRIKRIGDVGLDSILPYESKLVENAVFSNLLIYIDKKINRSMFNIRDHLFYIKDRTGEIDFYINKKKIEVKWTNNFIKKPDILYLTKSSLSRNEIPVYQFLYDIEKYVGL